MTVERRSFIKTAGLGLAAGGLATGAPAGTASDGGCAIPGLGLNRQGPKEVVRDKQAVAASQSPIVTRTMLDVLSGAATPSTPSWPAASPRPRCRST